MSNFPTGTGAKCSVTMCQNQSSSISEYCTKHKQRLVKNGHPTTKAIDLRRAEGKEQRVWIQNFIEDELRSNEDLAESIAWLKVWVSQEARQPSKGQVFFKRMYDQMNDESYLKVVSGVATLVANHMHNPHSIEAGMPLVRQTAMWTLFGATKAPYNKKKGEKTVSTAYYCGAPILDKVGQTVLEEIGKELSYLAQRAVKLSPYFARKKGM